MLITRAARCTYTAAGCWNRQGLEDNGSPKVFLEKIGSQRILLKDYDSQISKTPCHDIFVQSRRLPSTFHSHCLNFSQEYLCPEVNPANVLSDGVRKSFVEFHPYSGRLFGLLVYSALFGIIILLRPGYFTISILLRLGFSSLL